jgi:hypothetical protein
MSDVISAETFQAVRIKKSIWDWDIPSDEKELTCNCDNKGGDTAGEEWTI